jgi:hypothetical protein
VPKGIRLTAAERREVQADHQNIEAQRTSADRQATARGIAPGNERDARRDKVK